MEILIKTRPNPDHETSYIAEVIGWDNHIISADGETELEAIRELLKPLKAVLDMEIEDGYGGDEDAKCTCPSAWVGIHGKCDLCGSK